MALPHADARSAALAVIVALVVVSTTAPLAAAAGATTVSIATADGLGVGETATVEVVVDEAAGGVGAAEFRVSVEDTSVARISNVTVPATETTSTDLAEDGSFVDVQYAFAETDDTGPVTIAAVTVEGAGPGTNWLALEPSAGNDAVVVYDEDGTGYDVTGTIGVDLSVTGAEDGGDGRSSGDSAGSGDDRADARTVADGDGILEPFGGSLWIPSVVGLALVVVVLVVIVGRRR